MTPETGQDNTIEKAILPKIWEINLNHHQRCQVAVVGHISQSWKFLMLVDVGENHILG
jgi:hypothetical protein